MVDNVEPDQMPHSAVSDLGLHFAHACLSDYLGKYGSSVFGIIQQPQYYCFNREQWPRWLSWMRRPTGDLEVAGSTPAEVGNILSWRLIMKYFLWSFFPFR